MELLVFQGVAVAQGVPVYVQRGAERRQECPFAQLYGAVGHLGLDVEGAEVGVAGQRTVYARHIVVHVAFHVLECDVGVYHYVVGDAHQHAELEPAAVYGYLRFEEFRFEVGDSYLRAQHVILRGGAETVLLGVDVGVIFRKFIVGLKHFVRGFGKHERIVSLVHLVHQVQSRGAGRFVGS